MIRIGHGFDVAEGPLLSSSNLQADLGSLAVIATKPGATRSERLREWTHELCWKGATLLAVGSAVGPVAEFFGASPATPGKERLSGRLANIGSTKQGLFTVDVGSREVTFLFGGAAGGISIPMDPSWSPDGARLVFEPEHRPDCLCL